MDRGLAALATAQHGVVARRQLATLGLARGAIDVRVRAGALIPLRRGIFAVGHRALSPRGHWLAAVLACGAGSGLSHGHAAALHGLLRGSPAAIHVTVPRRTSRRHPGLVVHRVAHFDLVTVDAIPCTTVARTLLDLAATAPAAVLKRAIRQAELMRSLDYDAIDLLLTSISHPRGARPLRAALASAPTEPDTRSALERRFLAACRRHGVPEPLVNVPFALGDGGYVTIDFFWPRQRVALETDGWETHGTHTAFREDRRRDMTLAALGVQSLRCTWDDVRDRTAALAAQVNEVLRDR